MKLLPRSRLAPHGAFGVLTPGYFDRFKSRSRISGLPTTLMGLIPFKVGSYTLLSLH